MTSNNGVLESKLWANSNQNGAGFLSPAQTVTFHHDYVFDATSIQQEVTD